jgi:hypothetical protein
MFQFIPLSVESCPQPGESGIRNKGQYHRYIHAIKRSGSIFPLFRFRYTQEEVFIVLSKGAASVIPKTASI